jgi:hypothetical protein
VILVTKDCFGSAGTIPSCSMKYCSGLGQGLGLSFSIVRWDIVGMLEGFLNLSLRPGLLSDLIATPVLSKPPKKHGSGLVRGWC